MRLDGEGLRVELPAGWEGGIVRNPARTRSAHRLQASAADDPEGGLEGQDDLAGDLEGAPDDREASRDDVRRDELVARNAGPGVTPDVDGSVVMPVTHLANFALPAALDVFGSQAVGGMVSGDSFVSLVEYGPAEVDTPLFERRGIPRRLLARDFSPAMLNRALPDQVGLQVFATEADRAFCLYVVASGRAALGRTVRDVNTVLATLEVTPR